MKSMKAAPSRTQKITVPKITRSRDSVKTNRRTNFPKTNEEYFKVAELINGRVAMIAWDFGILKDWATGQSLEQQFDTSLPEVTLLSLLLTFATFASLPVKGKEDGIWKQESELLNGRAAMLGLVGVAGYEIIKNNFS